MTIKCLGRNLLSTGDEYFDFRVTVTTDLFSSKTILYSISRAEAQAIYNQLAVALPVPTLVNYGDIPEPKERGLFGKYTIQKTDGSPVDPKARYFVLRIDTDQAAREALETYADYIEYDEPELAAELRQWLTDTLPGGPLFNGGKNV